MFGDCESMTLRDTLCVSAQVRGRARIIQACLMMLTLPSRKCGAVRGIRATKGWDKAMLGTLVNAIAVILGGTVGLLCKGRLATRITDNLTKAVGLCVCIIGVSSAIQGDAMLLVVSLGLGTLLGEVVDIDRRLNQLAQWMEERFRKPGKDVNVAQGFVTATLLFCVGAMSIVGAIDGGLRGNHEILFTKSLLDGTAAIVLASTLGFGVLLSSLAVLGYQGGIALLSGYLQPFLTNELILQVSAAGGVMILGLGFNLALDRQIKVANQLPGLLVAAAYFFLVLK